MTDDQFGALADILVQLLLFLVGWLIEFLQQPWG